MAAQGERLWVAGVVEGAVDPVEVGHEVGVHRAERWYECGSSKTRW